MTKTDSFMEERIRWRAKIHKFPSKNTLFWEDCPGELKPKVPVTLGRPVLLSSKDTENFVLVCTRGTLVMTNGKTEDFLFSDISSVTCPPMENEEKKEDLNQLLFKLKNGTEVTIYPEPNKATFSVWNILLMLERMS